MILKEGHGDTAMHDNSYDKQQNICTTMQDRELEENFNKIRELVSELRLKKETAEKCVAEWNKEEEIKKLQAEIKTLRHQMDCGFNPSEVQ